ncbi:MAG: hypothetical protein WCG25_08720 [bacterium]
MFADIAFTTRNNHRNTGIWINNIKHHFSGPFPSCLKTFIVSFDNISGLSLYFSCISFNFGCKSAIHFCILFQAEDCLIRINLILSVRSIIAIPKFHQKIFKNTTNKLNIGR